MLYDIDIPKVGLTTGNVHVALKSADGSMPTVVFETEQQTRRIEQQLVGMRYDNAVIAASRVCGVCSPSHRLASVTAVERVLGISVSENAALQRTLYLESTYLIDHATHLLSTAIPPIAAQEGILIQAAEAEQAAKDIAAAGRAIAVALFGDSVHPFGLVCGEPSAKLDKSALETVVDAGDGLLQSAELLCDFVSQMDTIRFASAGEYLALVDEGRYPLIADTCATKLGADTFASSDLARRFDVLAGQFENDPWQLEREGGRVLHVGPIARVNHSWKNLGSRARNAAAKAGIRPLVTNGFKMMLCEAVELVDMVERCVRDARRLIMADQRDTPSVLIHRYGRAGDATTVIESPRGTLSHRIALDEKGMVTDCRILTPAVVNRLALIDDIITLARSLDGMDSDNLRELIVLLVRSYRICAPCLVR